MKTLLVGVTGTVGEAVARRLVAAKADVRALVRKPTAIAGVETVVGTLEDRASLARALDGVQRVFFVTPHAPNEEAIGNALVEAAEAARVNRIVFSAAYSPPVWNRAALWLLHAALGVIGPHYRAKLAVARRVRRSIDPVLLLPSNFYQNDDLLLAAIRGGQYPQAIGARGVNRVDVEDIAVAAERALLGDVRAGAYVVVGPRSYTQAECAEIWSEALGRRVVAGGEFGAAAKLDEQKTRDFERTFRVLQKYGVPTKVHEVEATTKLLGRAPRRYEDYVRSRCAVEERREHAV